MMGARNVKAVYAAWLHLGELPFRVLVWMALTSRDDDHPPRYWQHRAELVSAVTGNADDASTRRVTRAVADLRHQGAIKPERRSAPGHTAAYLLNLPADRAPSTERRTPSASCVPTTLMDGTEDIPTMPVDGTQDVSEPNAGRPRRPVNAGHSRRPVEEESLGEEEHPSPRARTAAHELIAQLGADEDETKQILEKITSKHRPGNLDAYVSTLDRNGDLEPYVAQTLAALRRERQTAQLHPASVSMSRTRVPSAVSSTVSGPSAQRWISCASDRAATRWAPYRSTRVRVSVGGATPAATRAIAATRPTRRGASGPGRAGGRSGSRAMWSAHTQRAASWATWSSTPAVWRRYRSTCSRSPCGRGRGSSSHRARMSSTTRCSVPESPSSCRSSSQAMTALRISGHATSGLLVAYARARSSERRRSVGVDPTAVSFRRSDPDL